MSNLYTLGKSQEIWHLADDMGIEIYRAREERDQRRVAIHLLKPSLGELEAALFKAERDQFTLIVLHTDATWPKGRAQ